MLSPSPIDTLIDTPSPPSFVLGGETGFFLLLRWGDWILLFFLRMNCLDNGLNFFFCSFENIWSLDAIDWGALVDVITRSMSFFIVQLR